MNKHFKSMLLGAAFVPVQAAFAEDAQLPAVTVIVPGQLLKDGQRAGQLATGANGSVMDLPFSVTSIDGERVRDQAGTTLQDALRNVPGAQADSGFNGSHTQFFILRGAISDNGTGANRILRDGARLSNYPYVPGFIESVDVLRGPGAAVGVRSEPGGTVNIVTRQPVMENGGSVLLSAGEHSAREYTIDVNRVLSVEDELAARIIATRSTSSEWRHVEDQLDGVKFGIAKSDGGRYRLRANIEAINQRYQPDYGIPADNGRPVDVPLDRQLGEPFADSTMNNRIVDLHGDVALTGDTRFTADLTHLRAHSTSVKNGLLGSPLPGQPAGTYRRFAGWEPDTQRRVDSLATSLTSEQMAGGYAHHLFFGLDYYKETLNQPSLTVPAAATPNINIYRPVYGGVKAPPPGTALAGALTTQYLKTVSASVQDQIELGAWALIAGLRFTDQDFVYGLADVRPVKEAQWSPKLGVLYRPSASQTLYANLASGTSPNQVASASKQSLPSRKAAQAELGWKSLWFDNALASEIALYHLKQTNMISSDPSVPAGSAFTVAGSARSRGLEGALTGFVSKHLNLAATYAYTDAVYLQNAVYGGKRVPNVARQSLTLWGQYHWSQAWKSGAGLYVQGKRYADEANTTTLPGYARIDLTQTWTQKLASGSAIEVQLALRNAFDQRYFVSSHLHVSRWITPAEGRNVSMTGTYRF